jgi:hypothetical protein
MSTSRVITVSPAAQAHFTSTPGPITVACGAIPAPSCLTYTNDGSGGCVIAGCVTSTQTAAPGLCGGQVTETWTFVDACQRTISTSRVITVTAAAQAHFTSTPGPITVACGAIPAPTCLTYTNEGSGGCMIAGCVTSTQTAAPGLCGGTVTETWSFTDQCGRTITKTRTITVQPAAQAHFVDPPGNIVAVVCGVAPQPTSLSYTNGQSGTCEIAGSVLSVITGGSTANCGTYTETWTFTDQCGRTITHSRNIQVPCCTACTYTQGAYGNPGGKGCVFPGPVVLSQNQIMINALMSEPGNFKVFGREDLNRYWYIRLTDVNQGNNSNIFKMLPGGTASKVFGLDIYRGVPEYSNGASWPVAPLGGGGKIMNQLFAQTLTLYFNLKNNINLGGFVLGDTLVTYDAVCGSNIPIPGTMQKVSIPHSVAAYLANPGNGYPNTVNGLFQLANDMLGGVVTGLSLEDVKTAIDNLNNGFDDCRILTGYIPYAGGNPPVVSRPDGTPGLAVTAFPNPYENDSNFNLQINAPVSGEAVIQLYTIDGVKISEIKRNIIANKDQLVTIYISGVYKTRLVYHVMIGKYSANGIVLSPN